MATNIILGSGIVGLCAKLILGDSWKIIPFYRSRYYSYNPALADNFVYYNQRLEPFFQSLVMMPKVMFYNIGFSVGGEIIRQYDSGLMTQWLAKIYGMEIPSHAHIVMKSRVGAVSIFDIRLNVLYMQLQNQMAPMLKEEAQKGQVTHIGKNTLTRRAENGAVETIEYDNLVSTIPLDKLYELMNVNHSLPFKATHYYHIQTDGLNFEGHNQLLVVDDILPFHRCTQLMPNRYLLYSMSDIPNVGLYLMRHMAKLDLLDGTVITNAVPCGDKPKLNWLLQDYKIKCIGSNAQWDDMADVGTNLLELFDYSRIINV